MLGQDGLGVKLHPFHGISFMTHAHNLAIFRPRGHF